MYFKIIVVGFVAFLFTGKFGDLPHPDMQALQGTWEIVSVERSGVADLGAVGYTLEFAGDTVHFQAPPWDGVVGYRNLVPMNPERWRDLALS